MCNLYSLTKGQAAIRDWFRAKHDRTGNLPLFPGIFPDQFAPIVRNAEGGGRELTMARWGMPGPPQYGGQPVTNTMEKADAYWRRRMFPPPVHPTVPLATAHKARLQWLSATDAMIAESMDWLAANGYEVTDQGTQPLTPQRRDLQRVARGMKPLSQH